MNILSEHLECELGMERLSPGSGGIIIGEGNSRASWNV